MKEIKHDGRLPNNMMRTNEVLSKQNESEVLAELMKIEANNIFRIQDIWSYSPNFYEKTFFVSQQKRLAQNR